MNMNLPVPFTTFGDSELAGNISGAGNQLWYQLSLDCTGGPITNCAVGSTNGAQILASVQAATADQLAGDVMLDIGRNDINTASYSSIFANASACAALITGNLLLMGMPTATVEPRGSFNWAQVMDTNRQLKEVFPLEYFDVWHWMQGQGNGSTQDNADIAGDFTLSRLRNIPPVNNLHFCGAGNGLIKDLIAEPWLAALHCGGAYIQPWQEFFVSGSAAVTAQTLGGAVATAAIVGTVDTIDIVGGDPNGDFAICTHGHLTRATSTILTVDRIALTIQIARNGQTMQGMMLIYLGAAGTLPSDIVFTGGLGLVQPLAPTGIDTQQLSGFFAFAPSNDGTTRYLWSTQTPGARLSCYLSSANRFVIIAKNSAGTTVLNMQTGSSGPGLITAAGGMVYVFFSVDLITGTVHLYVNGTATLGSGVTATVGATMNLSTRHLVGAENWSAGAPVNCFAGTFRQAWLGAGLIDWPTHFSDVYVPTTKAAVDLGASGIVAGVAPLFDLAGAPADWRSGWTVNRGSAGRFVGAATPGSTFTLAV